METVLTEKNFDSFIKEHDAVLVDFWASWCGPCRMLAPVVAGVAEAHPELAVGKVNVDEEGELAIRFRVMSIPMLQLYKKGQLVAQQVGYMPPDALEQLVARAL